MMLPAFVEQGQGDVVLLLHGIGGSKAIWGESLGALAAAGYRAVAMDFPGYGDSPGVATLQAMVESGLALLNHLGAERSVLVGHSMGGMVAQELVAGAPRRVQALVLACTSSAFGKPEGDWQARFVADRLAPLDAGLGMAGMAAKLVPGMVAPGSVPAALATSMAVMARVPEATYRTALRAIAAFNRRAALAEIRIPTLCLAGEHDRTAPPEVMLRMAQRIAGAEYRCLSDAGHIANVEQPEEFNAAVVDFLRRALP
jgi:pimeloyl-ACP methyl ester carboxylesterase